jgi:hypothetical protein
LDGGEPTKQEWVEIYLEQADEMIAVVRDALKTKVKDVQGLSEWEEPLAAVSGFLADSEPYQADNRDLQKARSKVRLARKDLKAQIEAYVKDWKSKNLDEDEEDDEE